jgi:RHS repeat-associated protein
VSTDSIYLSTSGAVDKVVTLISGQRFEVGYRRNNINQVDSIGVTGGGITFATRRYGWNRETGELDTISVNDSATRFVHNKDLLPVQTIWPSVTRSEQWTAIHRPAEQSFSVAQIDTAFFRRYSYDSRFGMQDYEKREGSNFRTRQRTYDRLRRMGGLGNNVYASSSCPQDTNNGFACPVSLQSTVTYDRVGNRADASDTLYAVGNRVIRFAGDSFSYDLDGNDTLKLNIASGLRKSFEWSADGRLTRVLINGVEKTKFDYNAQGQLIRRSTNGSVDRFYLWEGDQLLAELDANATHRVSEYAYMPGVDQPFALITGATSIDSVRYHVLDQAGNVIGVTSGTGVSQATTYDDWGVATTTGSADNRLLFKGLLWEPDAGLYYARARWYDPTTGRFASEDPIGLAGGINQYTFAQNDPTNLSDPNGKCLICIAALIGAVANVVIHGVRNTNHHKPFFKGAGRAALTGAAVGATVGGVAQFAPGLGLGALRFAGGVHALALVFPSSFDGVLITDNYEPALIGCPDRRVTFSRVGFTDSFSWNPFRWLYHQTVSVSPTGPKVTPPSDDNPGKPGLEVRTYRGTLTMRDLTVKPDKFDIVGSVVCVSGGYVFETR